MNINQKNFNIILSSQSDENSFTGIFDTIVCKKDKKEAHFFINIIYSIFVVDDSDNNKLSFKLTAKCINESNKAALKILDDNICLQQNDNNGKSIKDFKTSTSNVDLPLNCKSAKNGRYCIDFETVFPYEGDYQFELFIVNNDVDNDEELVSIRPFKVVFE